MGSIFTVFLFVLTCTFSLNEKNVLINNYIDQYKDIAIIEMHRTGVPASITLAQALHESQYGQSKLARYANNHFGIKCKSYWRGKTYMHKDDDFDDGGNLIESCFRAYDSVVDSYVDHSNFLTQTSHYQFLFSYDRLDYMQWAHGLKKAGYATDPNYAFALIEKIEEYRLHEFDRAENPYLKIKSLNKN